MIDWLTLKIQRSHVPAAIYEEIERRFGRLMMIDSDGQIAWERVSRDSLRSDTHRLVVDPGSEHFMLHGSPARVMAENNVFGEDDPVTCALAMIDFASTQLGHVLPRDPRAWKCTRIDVTHNYDLGSPAEVRQALSCLRQSEGGRFQVRTASETVYWGQNSAIRTMKAYHKGPHLRHQLKKQEAIASDYEVALADRLLRLELSLKAQFWRERTRKEWYDYTANELEDLHAHYFGQVIGKIEVTEMDNLQEAFKAACERLKAEHLEDKPDGYKSHFTEGLAMSAYRTWALIKSIGYREAHASMPCRTFERHLQVMKGVGLTFADLHAGNVLPLRRRTIELGNPVRCWDDFKRVA